MTLLLYLIKLMLCSAVLTGYYFFVLRNRSFHIYNRYYLLLSFLLSITLPLLRFPFLDAGGANAIPVFKPFSSSMLPEVVLSLSTTANQSDNHSGFIIFALYAVVVVLLFFQLFRSIFHLITLRKKYEAVKMEEVMVFFTNEPGAPFSFFNWIFWDNTLDPATAAGQQVLQHELYHVKEKHSIDLLFASAITSIFWFNPFFHFIKKELKTLHEFLADKAATSVTGKHEYAEMLLLHAIGEKKHQLSHTFFNNEIKRRIAMMTTSHKTSFAYLRRIMCLPFLFMLCIACSRSVDKASELKSENSSTHDAEVQREYMTVKDTPVIAMKDFERIFSTNNLSKGISMQRSNENYVLTFDSGKVYLIPVKEVEAYKEAHKNDKDKPQIKEPASEEETFTKVDIEPEFPGGVGAWMQFLNKTFHYPDEAVEKEIQGTVVVMFMVDKEGNVHDVTALSGPELLKTEAVRVIRESKKWLPAMQDGRKVNAYRKQPITFRLQSE